jgi:hypothetical protein
MTIEKTVNREARSYAEVRPIHCLITMISVLFGSAVHGQQPFQTWLTYNHQARLSAKWGYTFDLNYRTRGVLPFNSSLSAARMGINFHPGPKLRITGGYAWFGTNVTGRDRLWLHENRLYYQGQYNQGHGKLNIIHRIRIEHRWRQQFASIDSDATFRNLTNRYRYLIQFDGPIKRDPARKTQLRWKVINEIFLHTQETVGFALFDQNRTLGGVIIALPKGHLQMAVLYQFIVQQQPLLRDIETIHSMRLTLFHTLDLRKRKPAATPDYEPVVE